MAGSKKNKPKIPLTAPSSIIDDADGELVVDLLAQLESRDPVVQTETASVVQTMHLEERADILESSQKKDPKSRFKARQVSPTSARVCLRNDVNDIGAQSSNTGTEVYR